MSDKLNTQNMQALESTEHDLLHPSVPEALHSRYGNTSPVKLQRTRASYATDSSLANVGTQDVVPSLQPGSSQPETGQRQTRPAPARDHCL